MCSPEFYGRGYYKRGDRIAAEHLASEYKKLGVRSYSSDYLQNYSFNVNSLEKVSFKINGKELVFGDNYMMNAISGSAKGSFRPLEVNASMMKNPKNLLTAFEIAGEKPLVILDSLGLKNPELYRFVKTMLPSGQFDISCLIEVYSRTPGCRVGRNELPWPFHLKNVPAIFFLTTGRAGGGHNIFDTAEKLPPYAYENFFKLVLQINEELERQEIR